MKAVGPVRMSLRNPQFGKLSMEENVKVVTIETDHEEEDLQDLIDEIELAEDMEEDIKPVCTAAKFPKYVSLWKGKAKIPKDLDAARSALQTRSSVVELCLRAQPLAMCLQ